MNIIKINCLSVYILILVLAGNLAFAADSYKDAREAQRAARNSSTYRAQVCRNVINNFVRDSSFARAMNNYCMYSDSFQINFKQSVYPQTNNDYRGYKDVYPFISSKFVIDSNNENIKTMRKLVEDHCKYNSAKLVKKDPNVCSSQRINSLFVF